ncbi:hypothetical protein GO755_33535 [Spirosoma sp. HMF4905]|uniref:PKD-like domain-containing protein n=1 Tax=Spirosoma arboris TaxID=2682092 RepID=A0A7K1SMH8_9BACT|nr:hypothetical protein [Spirosoma arboris]MVM34999.1 hypothetical protein [Spirosoma arboris]
MKRIILLAFVSFITTLSSFSQGLNNTSGAVCVNELSVFNYGRHCLNSNTRWTVTGGVFTENNSTSIDNTAITQHTVQWTSGVVPAGGYKITVEEYCPTVTYLTSGTFTGKIPNVEKITSGGFNDPNSLAVPCGSTANVTIYAYVNKAAGNQVQGDFDGTYSIGLPSGWSTISKSYQGISTYDGHDYYVYQIVLQPHATSAGNFSLRNTTSCSGVSQYSDQRYFTISRSAANYSITGGTLVCSTNTYSISDSYISSYSWSTSSNLYVSSGQGTGSPQVTYNLSNPGAGYVQASVSDACGNSNIVQTKNIYVGPPAHSITGPSSICLNNPETYDLTNNNIYEASTISWSSSSGNLSVYSANPIAYVTALATGSYYLNATGINACGSVTYNYLVTATDCGIMSKVSPNPAGNDLNVEFLNVDSAESLPDEIDLLPENSLIPVQVVNVKETYKNNKLGNNPSIQMNVKDIPRGIYYLHIYKQDQKTPVNRTRVILN